MNSNTILMAIIALLILALLIIFLIKKPKDHKVNYKALFTLGLIFFAIGIASQNPSMWTLGLVFLGIGMLNKDKWKKTKK